MMRKGSKWWMDLTLLYSLHLKNHLVQVKLGKRKNGSKPWTWNIKHSLRTTLGSWKNFQRTKGQLDASGSSKSRQIKMDQSTNTRQGWWQKDMHKNMG